MRLGRIVRASEARTHFEAFYQVKNRSLVIST
jgi:hypothetical protein